MKKIIIWLPLIDGILSNRSEIEDNLKNFVSLDKG